MKKIILKIKQKGLMFNLGKNKFRSPVDIDVTYTNLNSIISQLKSNGIIDYEINTFGKDDIVNNRLYKNLVPTEVYTVGY